MVSAKKIGSVIWDYSVLSVGTLLYCLAWTSFLIPNGIASGGLTGACTILNFATGIPVSTSFIIANVFLLTMGFLILGNAFGFKTIYAIGLSTVLLRYLPEFDMLLATPDNPFLYVGDDNRILIPVIGGLMEALGISMIFKRGGSTGGTDVIALIMNKFWPISPGKVYMFLDFVIIATILLLPGKAVKDLLYGYITMFVFSFSLDALIMGTKSSMQVLVFSNKNEEMADYILKRMNRGVTALKAVGGYSREEKNILLIIIRKTQLHDLTKAIKKIDKDAFVSISQASDVYGRGFDEIKTGIDKKVKPSKKQVDVVEEKDKEQETK